MNTDTKTVEGFSAILEERRSTPLTVIAGGREVSVYEKGIDFLMRAGAADPAAMDKLERLMEMQERWMETQARMAFVAAMAQFKQNPPEILKTKLVEFESRHGDGKTSYMHEDLGVICELIVKGLADVGISHRWKPHREPGQVGVSCVLTHQLGHEQDDGALWAGADTSGKKNSIQAMASTTKYLERYTLLMATGLAPKGLGDDDGRGHADPAQQWDWVDEYLEAIQHAEDLPGLMAAWKTAAGAARRKQARDSYNELQEAVMARAAELGITQEQWAAACGKKS